MPINWNRRKYTEEQFRQAWLSANSVMECLRNLGLNEYGSAHQIAKDTAKELGLDNSHMSGQGWLKGKTHAFTPSRKLEEILVYGKKENNTELKKKLVRAGLKEWRCERCNLDNWLGEKITIELEHIDGDNKNNVIDNLMFLCPNCHSYTDTWRGRNIKSYGRLDKLEKSASSKVASKEGNLDAGSNPPPPTCIDCGSSISRNCKRCKKCYHKSIEKIVWPTDEEILKMVNETSFLATGRKIGVSDNAVRKRLKTRGLL